MVQSARELRELADKIQSCCAASHANSIARRIVANAADHLRAIANIHEANARGLCCDEELKALARRKY